MHAYIHVIHIHVYICVYIYTQLCIGIATYIVTLT